MATVSGLADPDMFVDADIASHPLMSAGEMPAEPDALLGGDFLDHLDVAGEPLGELIAPDNV